MLFESASVLWFNDVLENSECFLRFFDDDSEMLCHRIVPAFCGGFGPSIYLFLVMLFGIRNFVVVRAYYCANVCLDREEFDELRLVGGWE